MTPGGVFARPETAPAPFGVRLRQRAFDPAVLAGPPTAAALCLFRMEGLIAAVPYWLIVALVLFAQVTSILAAAFWTGYPRRHELGAYLGIVMGVIGVVAYSTGWGPILSLGFIFGAAYGLRISGSRAAAPAMAWTVVYMTLGQLAIALGIAPTLLRKPLVHGLAGIALLGVLFTIALLGRFTKDREVVEAEVRHSEQRFKALVRHAADIIVVTDPDGNPSYVSPAFERVLGRAATEASVQSVEELMHPEDLARLRETMSDDTIDATEGLLSELRLSDTSGRWHWFEATVSDLRDDANVGGIVANLHEITERKRTEDALKEAHERFRSAFDNAPIGIGLSDLEGNLFQANSAYARIVGIDVGEMSGMNVHQLTHPDDREASASEMRRLVTSDSDGYRIEKRYKHADGRDVWVSVSVSCVRDAEGEPLYLIGQVEDITERRALRERLAYAAIHDPLTGLPNRVLFMDRLETALNRALRQGRQVAVVFLDLDNFKLVNDSMGHGAGDRLLEDVAERLRTAVRPSDTVARFGGDEFVVLCEEISDKALAGEIADRLTSSLVPPVRLSEGEVFVTASLGVAISGSVDSPASLVRDADTAMYLAKERGRARVEIFDQQSHEVAIEQMTIRNELHRALERDEFRVFYQPIVELPGGRLAGVEALVRWQHPERGLLHPAEFLPTAEESGLIVPIGLWVLEESCRQAVAWEKERLRLRLGGSTVTMSVNVSPLQLAEPGFLSEVCAVVERTGIEPWALSLEITEGSLAGDTESTVEVLQGLRSRGIGLSIDDFGSGYASFGHLRSFPVDSVKIDRSFVAGLQRGAEDETIVASVISLARSLKLNCVAEGVERPRQLAKLLRLGCGYVQGMLLGVPLPAQSLGDALGDDLSLWDTDASRVFRRRRKSA